MSEKPEDPRTVPADQRSQGPNETMMLSSEELDNKVASTAAGVKQVINGTPRLVGRSDVVAGRTIELTTAKTTVGRQESSDIMIDDGTVSARHAQIVTDGGVWRVVNLISTNGTSVNGHTAIVSYLAPGDIVAFGRVEFLFEVEGQQKASSAASASSSASGGGNALLWVAIGVGALVIAGVGAFALLG